MAHGLAELWSEITARPSGKMAFRFYLQPLMAMILATRDGIRDARSGRPAYFWALFSDSGHRRDRLREGWKSIGRVFILALIVDGIYQLAILRGWRPGQGLIVAMIVALIPYLFLRGPAKRLATVVIRASKRRHSAA